MKKESIIAIILGIVTGILCAYFLIQITKDKQKGVKKEISTPTISIPVLTNNKAEFEIISPEDNFVSGVKEILIQGNAPNETLILIITPESEYVIKTKKTDFTQKVTLQEGENIIKIQFIKNNNIKTKTLTVYYIPE